MERKILVVDDEASIRDVLGDFFRRAGFGVATAATIEEGRQQTQATSFDLILLDVGLANENGLDLIAILKKQRPQASVVILTGRGFDGDLMNEALQLGASGYLAKGLPMEELLASVKRALAE